MLKQILLDSSDVGMTLLDGRNRIKVWNAAASNQLLLMNRTTLVEDAPFEHHIPGEHRPIVVDAIQRAREGTSTDVVLMHNDGHGNTVYHRVECRSVTDPGSSERYVVVTSRDTTEAFIHTEHLRASQRQYRRLIEQSSDGMMVIDGMGVVASVSPSSERYLGFRETDLVGPFRYDRIHADDRERMMSAFDSVMKEESGVEHLTLRFVHRNGRTVWLDAVLHNMLDVPDVQAVILTYRDATQRKEYEEYLATNERRLRSLVQTGDDLISILDDVGGYLYVGPTHAHVLGLDPGELTGKNLFAFIHPDDHGRVMHGLRSVMPDRRVELAPYRYMAADDEWHWVETILTDQRSEPTIRGIVANSRDVSVKLAQQRMLESALAERRKIMELSQDIICTFDAAWRCTTMNAACRRILGREPDEAIGMDYLAIVHPDDIGNTVAALSSIMAGEVMMTFDNRCIHANGSTVPLSWNVYWSGEDDTLFCVARDMTEKLGIETEEEIQKLITLSISSSTSLEHGIVRILERLIAFSNWDTAELFIDDYARKNLQHHACYHPDDPALARFCRLGMEGRIPKGVGIPGRTYADGRTQWIADVPSAVHETRRPAALESDLKTGVSIPIYHHGTVVAVLVLFSRYVIERNDRMVALLTRLCSHLGSELERKRSSELLDKFFDLSPDTFGILSEEGTILRTNRPELFTGPAYGKIGDLPFFDILNADDRPAEGTAFWTMVMETGTWSFEARLSFQVDGRERWQSWTLRYDENERVFFAVAKDVTEGRHAARTIRESAQQLLNILESIGDGFIAVDTSWNITYWNHEAERLLLRRREDMVGCNILERLSGPDMRMFQRQLSKALETGRTVRFEEYHHELDRWFEIAIYPSENELSVYFRDITDRHRKEDELRASNRRFQVVTMATNDAIWDWDLVGDSVLMGFGFESLFGYDSEQKVSSVTKWSDRIHEEDRDRVLDGLRLVLDSGRDVKWEDEYRYRRKDGAFAVVSDCGYVLRDGAGHAFRMIGAMQDITDRKRIEKELRTSNERYELVSAATNDAIWDWDFATDLLYWSKGFTTIFGYDTLNDVPTLDQWYARIHPDDVGRVHHAIEGIIGDVHATTWEDEYRYRAADGRYLDVYDRGYVIRDADGIPVRMIGAMQDVSERKDYERRLLELNQSLAVRAQELADSNAELEHFAYLASHDLIEPLRMVRSFIHLLDTTYGQDFDETARQYVGFAIDGADRMQQLIKDLLEFSRIGTHTEPLSDVDVGELLADLRTLYGLTIGELQATVSIGAMPVIQGYPTQIRQVWQNLLGNALKYHGSAPLTVTIEAMETPTAWEFSIADNGIGIEPRFFERIFVIFQRLHSREDYSGTGIGLAICKKIVERHGGRIWVESQPGSGSTFFFTIARP